MSLHDPEMLVHSAQEQPTPSSSAQGGHRGGYRLITAVDVNCPATLRTIWGTWSCLERRGQHTGVQVRPWAMPPMATGIPPFASPMSTGRNRQSPPVPKEDCPYCPWRRGPAPARRVNVKRKSGRRADPTGRTHQLGGSGDAAVCGAWTTADKDGRVVLVNGRMQLHPQEALFQARALQRSAAFAGYHKRREGAPSGGCSWESGRPATSGGPKPGSCTWRPIWPRPRHWWRECELVARPSGSCRLSGNTEARAARQSGSAQIWPLRRLLNQGFSSAFLVVRNNPRSPTLLQ